VGEGYLDCRRGREGPLEGKEKKGPELTVITVPMFSMYSTTVLAELIQNLERNGGVKLDMISTRESRYLMYIWTGLR